MSEGKVEQWMRDFADNLFDGVQPDTDDCIKLLVKYAPSHAPSESPTQGLFYRVHVTCGDVRKCVVDNDHSECRDEFHPTELSLAAAPAENMQLYTMPSGVIVATDDPKLLAEAYARGVTDAAAIATRCGKQNQPNSKTEAGDFDVLLAARDEANAIAAIQLALLRANPYVETAKEEGSDEDSH